MISLLERLVRPRLRHLGSTVTVYSRQACCCCHKAIDLLESRRARHGFAIEVIDIDGDPALVEAYGLTVPVVAFDGKVRFKGVVNPALLDRLLQAETKNAV